MRKKGKNMEFISWIDRNGLGVTLINDEHVQSLNEEWFAIKCLSLTNKTYIAAGFNSYVVRLKS